MISVSVIFTRTLFIACFNKSLRPSSGDQMRGNSSSQLLDYMNDHKLLKNNSHRKVCYFSQKSVCWHFSFRFWRIAGFQLKV